MKLSINKQTTKKGFTLIELLVVIAILSSLAGLSYGPIMKFIRSADLTKANKVCKDLTIAINDFELTYDSLPYTGDAYPDKEQPIKTTGTEGEAFLKVLMGKDLNINDKAKEFFTADQAKGSKDGLIYGTNDEVEKLLDKWGNPYSILLDYNADGQVDASQMLEGGEEGGEDPEPASGDSSYKEKLHITNSIAASAGPDQEFNDVQDAKSW